MKICKIDDCSNIQRARGMCQKHYARWYKHGDPTISLRKRETWKGKHRCTIEDCKNIRVAQGYCKKHYNRFIRHGSPFVVIYEYGINKNKTCYIEDCSGKASARGLCQKHYKRHKKYGDPTKTFMDFRIPKICRVEYCSRSADAFGYCQFHYKLIKAKDSICNKSFEELYGNPPYQCYLCGKTYEQCTSEFFELDHIIPVSRGGETLKNNVKLVCVQCNRSKHNLTNIEFVNLCHQISSFHS